MKNEIIDRVFCDHHFISISPFNPFGVDTGVNLRIRSSVQYLEHYQKHKMMVIRDDDFSPEQSPIKTPILRGGRNKYSHLLHLPSVVAILRYRRENKDTPLALYCHSFWSGFYGIVCRWFGFEFVYDAHNVEATTMTRFGKWGRLIIGWLERCFVRRSLLTLTCSGEDRAELRRRYGGGNLIEVLPTTPSQPSSVYWENYDALRQSIRSQNNTHSETMVLLFVCSFEYFPNREAIEFLDQTIAPHFKSDSIEIWITGRNTEQYQPIHSNVWAFGYVDSLDGYFAACDWVVVPLLSGGGIKIKTLTALGYGKPILATPEGVTGIEVANHREFLTVCEPDQFLPTLQTLLAESTAVDNRAE